jgi:predicted RNA binding protein YcfA (HicA-like mRNA interferase family)
MSERLPRLTAKEIIRILERHGFNLSRSSGSHHIYKNSEGKRVTVPVHAGKIIHPKILISILRDMGMTPEELKEELGR